MTARSTCPISLGSSVAAYRAYEGFVGHADLEAAAAYSVEWSILA